MQSPGGIFCKKSIKLVLNYHGRPSSQITPMIIIQHIMLFKNCCELLQIFGETGARESAIQCVLVILFLALVDSLGHM